MNSKAWFILTEEERSALMLSINHGKSSWQAGEILKKAHYKYLEIQSRARHFFKIFQEYYNITGDLLIPINSDIHPDFQTFIKCIICDRKGYRDTLKIVGKGSKLTHKKSVVRIEELENNMLKLREHECPIHRKLHDLILEFDRWNNFRVLPISLQEPSAFKRRNKTRLLKHLKNLNKLEPFLIDRLSIRFAATNSYKSKVLYLPLVSDSMTEGYNVVKIKATEKIVEYISKVLNLYMFKEKDKAEEYGLLVEQYLNKPNKNCRQGQLFWPKYRLLIKTSSNYYIVNNIIPRRENLVNAFRDLDKLQLKKQLDKKEIIVKPADRAKDNKFWSI